MMPFSFLRIWIGYVYLLTLSVSITSTLDMVPCSLRMAKTLKFEKSAVKLRFKLKYSIFCPKNALALKRSHLHIFICNLCELEYSSKIQRRKNIKDQRWT